MVSIVDILMIQSVDFPVPSIASGLLSLWFVQIAAGQRRSFNFAQTGVSLDPSSC